MKYIALLRGINVGGKHSVPMPELKKCFESLGFKNVVTYINSGNVIFEASDTKEAKLVQVCESAIEKKFGFHIICSVISAAELEDAFEHMPAWWDKDKDARHNAIFVIAPKTAKEVMEEIGETKPEYEKIATHGPIIFWTAPAATFSRTRYSKIVGSRAYKDITIRNANTTKKLLELSRE